MVFDGPVSLEHTMRHQPVRCALGLHFFRRLAERQCLRLRKHVGYQEVMMPAERNQLRSLMDQLVERVLPIGSGFTQ